MSHLKVLAFPEKNLADVPATLRRLADDIEKGELGKVSSLAWVCSESTAEQMNLHVGLMGEAQDSVALAYYMLALAQRKLEV